MAWGLCTSEVGWLRGMLWWCPVPGLPPPPHCPFKDTELQEGSCLVSPAVLQPLVSGPPELVAWFYCWAVPSSASALQLPPPTEEQSLAVSESWC